MSIRCDIGQYPSHYTLLIVVEGQINSLPLNSIFYQVLTYCDSIRVRFKRNTDSHIRNKPEHEVHVCVKKTLKYREKSLAIFPLSRPN